MDVGLIVVYQVTCAGRNKKMINHFQQDNFLTDRFLPSPVIQ